MGHKEIEEYLGAIDFSMVTDVAVLDNIYKEIAGSESELACSVYANNSMERLVMMSSPEQLLGLLDRIGPKVVYKKLGSRIIEAVYKRLFECMYIRNEKFDLERAVKNVEPGLYINCRNATHVLRRVMMLLSAKDIKGTRIEKYKCEGGKSGTEILRKYKEELLKELPKLEDTDAFGTLAVYAQVTRSQSFLSSILSADCTPENIKKRSYAYEIFASVANRENLDLIFARIRRHIMELALGDSTNYMFQTFIRNFRRPDRVFKRIDFEKFDRSSNVLLALLESLQARRCYREVDVLMEKVYKPETSIFSEFLLGRDEGLDSKYVNAIVNFMALPGRHGRSTREDFCRYFKPSWLGSRSGRTLVCGYAASCDTLSNKNAFFDKNIDLFWQCSKWKEGRSFARLLTDNTTGHARKKAFEMLSSARCAKGV